MVREWDVLPPKFHRPIEETFTSSGAGKFANVMGVGSFSGRVALDECPLALAMHKEVSLSLVSIIVEHQQA
jgi:hypothetical protein